MISYNIVMKWRRVSEGCIEIEDGPDPGRYSVITNIFQALIEQDERSIVAEIERYFRDVVCNPISHGKVLEIIPKNCYELWY